VRGTEEKASGGTNRFVLCDKGEREEMVPGPNSRPEEEGRGGLIEPLEYMGGEGPYTRKGKIEYV